MQATLDTEMPYGIVLSSFNGKEWIGAQVASIRAQTAARWKLYIRDDGSTDGTRELLSELAAADPRVEVLPDEGRNLGPIASFGRLLQHALDRGERYVFLSDQDDVWLPDKCALMLAHMRASEAASGDDVPLLVHSDLSVVDGQLAPLHPSFMALQRIRGRDDEAAVRVLVGNSVTGCASLCNAALLRCALPIPDVGMHDWWLAVCAGAFGEIHFVDAQTVKYRQHGTNTVGARGLARRARDMARNPREWWLTSARRFLRGLHQVWAVRFRARERGLPVRPEVDRSIETLWQGLGIDSASLGSRLSAAIRSGALPRARLMQALFLSRVAVLPALRARLGDERDGIEGARHVPRGEPGMVA
jgi:glycosyltransferase involved in cell wall biosynthesis